MELYREVQTNMNDLNLSAVAYVCVDMSNIDKEGANYDDAVGKLVARLLKFYAEGPNNKADALGARPTLEALVESIFPVTDARVALFLHLDEFHKNEWATTALVAEVRNYNSSNLNRPILLVGSGLYTSLAQLGLSSSGERGKLEVRFLHFDRAYELVRSAAGAVRRK